MKKVLQSIVLLLGVLMLPASALAQNIYGDVNGDLEVNIADVNVVINVILKDVNNEAADVNKDSEINIADVNAIIDIILNGGIDSQLLEVCNKVAEIDQEITEFYLQSKSLEELMLHADEIEALDGVEYVFSNNNSTLYVAIEDFGTISYSYFPKLEKNNDYSIATRLSSRQLYQKANIGEPYEHLIDQSDSKALLVFQMGKDNEWNMSHDEINVLSEHFGYAGIYSEIRTSLDVEFFRNGLFDCDYLYILTHGEYEFDSKKYEKDHLYRGTHWLLTTEEMSSFDPLYYYQLAQMRLAYNKEDVSVAHVTEQRNNKTVSVCYKKVSDHFIKSSSRSFNHPGKAVVFNAACHSMQGPRYNIYDGDSINYNFATVFENRGAGAYFGYDDENSHGDTGAIQFYCNLISGMSLKSTFDNLQFQISHDYKIGDSRTWWADLIPHYQSADFLNTCIVRPKIRFNDESTDNELRVNLHATIHAASFYSDFNYTYNSEKQKWVESSSSGFDYIETLIYGFELSESEQFSNVILLDEKTVHDEGCEFDESRFELDFSQSLTYSSSQTDSKIKPNTTYWVRAYVYDGQGYNYSEPITFTTGSISGVTQEHEYVDLGLPSGTLWATCNVGANSPEECGDYFAWGETEPKESYDLDNYKWCNGSRTTMTKYCTNSNYGTVDNKSELDPEDDAATVNWGSSWRMPSREQQQELITNCTWQWVTRNGVDGGLATGPNGNTIFFPAVGFCSGGGLNYPYSQGRYLSRTLDQSIQYMCYCIKFDSRTIKSENTLRHLGYTVRAVRVSQN